MEADVPGRQLALQHPKSNLEILRIIWDESQYQNGDFLKRYSNDNHNVACIHRGKKMDQWVFFFF